MRAVGVAVGDGVERFERRRDSPAGETWIVNLPSVSSATAVAKVSAPP